MITSTTQKLAICCCLLASLGASVQGNDFLVDSNAVEVAPQSEPHAVLNVRLKEVGTILKAEATIGAKTLPVTVAPVSSHKVAVYFLLDVSANNKEFLPASRAIVQQMADRLSPTADYDIGLGTVGSRFVPLSNSSPDKEGRDALLKPVGNSPDPTAEIYRCVLDALGHLKRFAGSERKVVVLLTSGQSDEKDANNFFDGVVAEANQQGVAIFTVGFAHSDKEKPQWGRIRRVASETGGTFIETAEKSNKHLPLNGDPGLELLGMLRSAAQLTIPLNDAPVGAQKLVVKLYVQNNNNPPLVGTVPIEVPAARAMGTATPPTATPAPSAEHPSASATATPLPAAASPPDQPRKEAATEARPAWSWAAITASAAALLGLLTFLIVKATRPARPPVTLPPINDLSADPGWGDNDDNEPPTFPDGKGHTEPSDLATLGWLEEIDKSGATLTRHAINKSKINIGRSADSDLRFDNSSVSVHHATIHRRSDGNFVITDLRASNKVYINGKRAEHSVLVNGDVIEFGEVRLRFVRDDSDGVR